MIYKTAERNISIITGILLMFEFITSSYNYFFTANHTAGFGQGAADLISNIICFIIIAVLYLITAARNKPYLYSIIVLMIIRIMLLLLTQIITPDAVSPERLNSQFLLRPLTYNRDVLIYLLIFAVLFFILFRLQLLPAAIAVWGIAAILIALIRLGITFFGNCPDLNLVYFFPFAAVRLFTSFWLIAGFSETLPVQRRVLRRAAHGRA